MKEVGSVLSSVVLRFLFALLIPALAFLTAPRPLHAATNPEVKCCAHTNGTTAEHPCAGERPPDKSPDDSHCHACALGLAFFWIAPPRFVYTLREAGQFSVMTATSIARFDSPPVPPPRV